MEKPNTDTKLQSLLTWGIENSTRDEAPTKTKKKLEKIDPKWIDIVLGKPDAVRMKDCMKQILNKDLPLDERLFAFDELESLAESIDNANDLKVCQLWEPLLQLLNDDLPEIRKFAAWVIATSIQNNPKATSHFVEKNGSQLLLKRIDLETEPIVMAKLINIASALVNQSHQYTVLMYSHGVVKKFLDYLLIVPPHSHSSRLFHFFSIIFSCETVEKMQNDAMVSSLLTTEFLKQVIKVHIQRSNVSTSIENCLDFLLIFKKHPLVQLSKEMAQSIITCIEPIDIETQLKEQVRLIAEM